jgi:hypothetical protein
MSQDKRATVEEKGFILARHLTAVSYRCLSRLVTAMIV